MVIKVCKYPFLGCKQYLPRSVYKHIKYSFNYTGNHRTLQNCFYDGKIYSNDYSGIYDKNAPDGALSNEAFPTGLDIISYYNYSTICGCAGYQEFLGLYKRSLTILLLMRQGVT